MQNGRVLVWAYSVPKLTAVFQQRGQDSLSVVMFWNNAVRPLRDIRGCRRYTYIARVSVQEAQKSLLALVSKCIREGRGLRQALTQIGNACTHTGLSQEGVQGSLCIQESLCSTVALGLYGVTRSSVALTVKTRFKSPLS